MEDPFEISIYDKSLSWIGTLGDASAVTPTVRHNVLSDCVLRVPAASRKMALLMTPGVRVVIRYRGEHLIGGPVRIRSGEGPAKHSFVDFTVHDDFRLLDRILAWPNPAGSMSQQGDDGAYYRKTGPAETVVKDVLAKNLSRLGLPVVIAPDQGRGGRVDLQFRFHAPSERFFPAVDQAGIGVQVRQENGHLVVDCYEPGSFPRELSEAAGTITSWKFVDSAFDASRVVVGGNGQGTARIFKQYTDPVREAESGDVIEVFRDARDSGEADVYAARAAETLTEGAARVGLSLALSESKIFTYGGPNGVHVGDRIPLNVGPVTITDTLREASLSYTRDAGLVVTPTVGEIDSPDRTIAKAFRRLYTAVKDMKAGT